MSNLAKIPVVIKDESEQTIFLEANLHIPQRSEGIIVFAHGSGSGRHSPRNQSWTKKLNADKWLMI